MNPIDAHVHLGNFPLGSLTEKLNVFGGLKLSHKAIHDILMKNTSGHRLDVKKFLSGNNLSGCVLVPLSKKDENFLENVRIKNVFRLKFFDYNTVRCELDGFDGYKIHPIIEKIDINSDKYSDFFATAAKKKIPLLIHIGFYPLKHHEKFGAIGRLEKLLDDHKLKMVVCHGGGEHWKKLAELSKSYEFYTDLSLCSHSAVERLYQELGAKKLIFGSDYPLGDPGTRNKIISRIANGEDLKKILYKNTLKLFG